MMLSVTLIGAFFCTTEGELSTMFSHEEAVKWQLVLLLVGLPSYAHQLGDRGWYVWLEDAGIALGDDAEVKGYLLLRWSAEQRANEMPRVVGQQQGEAVYG